MYEFFVIYIANIFFQFMTSLSKKTLPFNLLVLNFNELQFIKFFMHNNFCHLYENSLHPLIV